MGGTVRGMGEPVWLARLDFDTRKFYDDWVKDAQWAWNEEAKFYLPTVLELIGDTELPEPFRPQGSRRAGRTEVVLEAIASVGWVLHTWDAGGLIPTDRGWTVTVAQPLFVRP